MKRSVYIIIIAIILILSGLLLFNRCSAPEQGPDEAEQAGQGAEDKRPVVTAGESSSATVYYATKDGKQLLPLTLVVNTSEEPARLALEYLLAGPPNELARDSVPTDTKLLDIYSIYHTVYVDFTREFLDIPAADAGLAVDAICATVLPLTEGYKLQILVEGKGYDYLHQIFIGEPLILPLINPVEQELRLELTESGAEYADVVYYRIDSISNYLIPLTLPVELSAEQGEQTLALAQAALERMLPEGLDLLSLEIIDSVACVNLSRPYTELGWSECYQNAWQEAVLRSLVALPRVEAVQFLAEGRVLEQAGNGNGAVAAQGVSTPINSIQ